MRESKDTIKAVVLSAFLHLGILAFLFLAVLPCSKYDAWFGMLGLKNPVQCAKPLELPGPIIEATLVGPTAAPPPKSPKLKPQPDIVPPPPSTPAPQQDVPRPKKTELPPPPEHPDIKHQERVVEEAPQPSELKHEQEERQKQPKMADLDAQKKAAEKRKIDELFAKMDALSQQTKKLDSKAKQAQQQLKDLENAKENGLAELPYAEQRQTGSNGHDTGLLVQYLAAIQNAVTQNWFRPDNMPDVPCVVHIVQVPGGDVISARVDSRCPYSEEGRRSVENAVMRAKPLPYQGFEKVFQRQLDFTFRPQ